MVLEQLKHGAQRQFSGFDEGTRQLITILCLPLIDGVFATLLVTGALRTLTDYVMVALTIFSGAGALAVLYSYSETRLEARKMVYKSVPILFAGALLVGLIAPIYETLFYSQRLSYTAALVLIVIAGKLGEIKIFNSVSTSTVLLTGLALSLKSPSALSLSLKYAVSAGLTVGVASAFLYAATFITHLDMNMDYIKKGSAAVLMLISLSVAGVNIPSELGLAVFAASLMVSMRQNVRISN